MLLAGHVEFSWWDIIWRLLVLSVILLVLGIGWVLRKAEEGHREAARQALLAEDARRYAAEQSWVDSGQWPLTHYDVYPTDWELTQDLARLKAMGYSIEWQEHTADGVAVTYSLTPAYERGASGGRR